MRVAISIWQNCISPVFDVSKELLLLDLKDKHAMEATVLKLENELPFMRAKKLADAGVDVLICGAISQPYAMAVEGYRIEIISYVFGPLEDILNSFINDQLTISSAVGKPRRKRYRRRNNRLFPEA